MVETGHYVDCSLEVSTKIWSVDKGFIGIVPQNELWQQKKPPSSRLKVICSFPGANKARGREANMIWLLMLFLPTLAYKVLKSRLDLTSENEEIY